VDSPAVRRCGEKEKRGRSSFRLTNAVPAGETGPPPVSVLLSAFGISTALDLASTGAEAIGHRLRRVHGRLVRLNQAADFPGADMAAASQAPEDPARATEDRAGSVLVEDSAEAEAAGAQVGSLFARP
jgi:hypothetical protein